MGTALPCQLQDLLKVGAEKRLHASLLLFLGSVHCSPQGFQNLVSRCRKGLHPLVKLPLRTEFLKRAAHEVEETHRK